MTKAGTKVARKPIAWSEAHMFEASVRSFELGGEVRREHGLAAALRMRWGIAVDTNSERAWRVWLSRADFDDDRINREVRRVDGLATGRLVRETPIRFETRREGHKTMVHDEWQNPDVHNVDSAVEYARSRNDMLDKLKSNQPRFVAVRVRVARIRRA